MPCIRTTGVEIEYEDSGSGEPLLMIMGLGAQLIYWPEGLVEQLRNAGFRTIRFDNRDAGKSTYLGEPESVPVRRLLARRALGLPVKSPYSLHDMAGDAVAVLDHLGLERAHVIGSSMGGMIAQCMALAHPHRLITLTSMMSSTGRFVDFMARPRALRVLLKKPEPGPQAAVEAIVGAYLTFSGRGLPISETIMRDIAQRAVVRGVNLAGMRRQIAAIAAGGDRSRALAGVTVPALIIHGDEDPLVRPRAARRLARAIPGSELLMIRGMGHGLPEGAWQSIVRAVRLHADRAAAADVEQRGSVAL